jgi:hypothetical protein
MTLTNQARNRPKLFSKKHDAALAISIARDYLPLADRYGIANRKGKSYG